jgi:DNA-binding NarL/FixJ family response regulator
MASETPASRKDSSLEDGSAPLADVLLVNLPEAAIGMLRSDFFSHAASGREALGMLKLLRFRLLVASLDVPDMPPRELFLKARQAQARLQCVLLDERMTYKDERQVRQVGAGAFASSNPDVLASLVRTPSSAKYKSPCKT